MHGISPYGPNTAQSPVANTAPYPPQCRPTLAKSASAREQFCEGGNWPKLFVYANTGLMAARSCLLVGHKLYPQLAARPTDAPMALLNVQAVLGSHWSLAAAGICTVVAHTSDNYGFIQHRLAVTLALGLHGSALLPLAGSGGPLPQIAVGFAVAMAVMFASEEARLRRRRQRDTGLLPLARPPEEPLKKKKAQCVSFYIDMHTASGLEGPSLDAADPTGGRVEPQKPVFEN